MHSYLVRIELQNPLLFDYTTLHQEMGKVGFKRTIQANTGIEYHLPNAEYVISTGVLRDIISRRDEQLMCAATAEKVYMEVTGLVREMRKKSTRFTGRDEELIAYFCNYFLKDRVIKELKTLADEQKKKDKAAR